MTIDRPDQPHPGTAPPLPSSPPPAPPSSPGALPWAITAQSDGFTPPGEDAADADDLDLLEPAWTPPRRVNRWTVVLAGGLVATLGFAGGVLVQKNHDAGLVAGSAGAGAAARAFARANGSGGSAGAGAPGVGGSGPSGTGSGGPGTSSGAPVVVGTVASVGDGILVVENFAGTKVTVKVPAGTPVTTAGLTGLGAGARVSVTGTKAADGTVTASSVVSRSRG